MALKKLWKITDITHCPWHKRTRRLKRRGYMADKNFQRWLSCWDSRLNDSEYKDFWPLSFVEVVVDKRLDNTKPGATALPATLAIALLSTENISDNTGINSATTIALERTAWGWFEGTIACTRIFFLNCHSSNKAELPNKTWCTWRKQHIENL